MRSRGWSGNRASILTLALLSLVTIAAWAGVVFDASAMAAGDDSMGAAMSDSGGMHASSGLGATVTAMLAYVVAWVVMMAAMMLPSAAPMILLYRSVARAQAAHGNLLVPTWIFVLGYLLVWAAFGVVVYIAGAVVGVAIDGDARLAGWAPYGVALVLVVAGAYQFTSLKLRCLRACQSPWGFLMSHWRAGRGGALGMGVAHGAYCAACCWGLMAVLVAAGAMALRWVLVIALVVAAEKLVPRGEWAARIAGVLLLALGAAVALQPELAQLLRG